MTLHSVFLAFQLHVDKTECVMGFVAVMWYCTACCMQDWQESSLCPSPAAADLSKDIPASCVLLMSPLHQLLFALVLMQYG